MRHIISAVVALSICVMPMAAKADWVFEGSVGTGWQVKPSVDLSRTPTNIMIAPGYGFGEWIRAELGILASLGDVKNQEFDLDVRPMLVVDPPLIPVYGRLLLGMSSLLNDPTFAYGVAVGIGGSIFGAGLFVEAGMVPRAAKPETIFILEGRAGVYFVFD